MLTGRQTKVLGGPSDVCERELLQGQRLRLRNLKDMGGYLGYSVSSATVSFSFSYSKALFEKAGEPREGTFIK